MFIITSVQLYCVALVPTLQCKVGTNATNMYVGQAVINLNVAYSSVSCSPGSWDATP